MTIVSEIVEAMNYLHSYEPPIYHLDLTSKNVLLDENYSVRITDFGLSKLGGESFKGIMGTPAYIAPEVFANTVDPTQIAKVDVYAFGILVNELITEEPPYYSNNIPTFEALKHLVLKGSHPEVAKKIPEELDSMIKNSWNRDPKERPSFQQLREEKPWEKAMEEVFNDGHKISKNILKIFTEFPSGVSFHLFSQRLAKILEDRRINFDEPSQLPEGIKINSYVHTLMVALSIPKITCDVRKDKVLTLCLWMQKK